MIPLSVPCFRGNEWAYVRECLDTGWVSSAGKYVEVFERNICAATGAKYAIACASGTAALHVALRVAGVMPGDEVIVPTLTFIAPVNAVRYLQAEPVFMDCDDFYNMDAEKTLAFLAEETEQRDGHAFHVKTGRRIAAAIPVHVFGNAADLAALSEACRTRNIRIVEDASESLGTRYAPSMLGGRHTGTIGEIGCLSFNGNKIVTSGGGGMILTDNPDYADRARYWTTQAKDDAIRYIHHDVGYNYRMTNMAAALGVAQLEQLDAFCEIKKARFEAYRDAVGEIEGLNLAEPPSYAHCNHWFHCLQIDAERYGTDRDGLLDRLNNAGIQARPVWHPNHWQRPYRNCRRWRIERALRLWETTVNLPCSAGLSDRQFEQVTEALKHG